MPDGWYQAGVYFTQPTYNNGYTGTDTGSVVPNMPMTNMNGLGNARGFNCLNCAPKIPSFAGPQLGYVMIDEGDPPVGVPWGMEKEGSMMYNRGVEYLRSGNWEQGKDLGFSFFRNPLEESFVWRYRKPLVIGGVAVAGLALLGLASSLLG
jgi:hypothetical protein